MSDLRGRIEKLEKRSTIQMPELPEHDRKEFLEWLRMNVLSELCLREWGNYTYPITDLELIGLSTIVAHMALTRDYPDCSSWRFPSGAVVQSVEGSVYLDCRNKVLVSDMPESIRSLLEHYEDVSWCRGKQRERIGNLHARWIDKGRPAEEEALSESQHTAIQQRFRWFRDDIPGEVAS